MYSMVSLWILLYLWSIFLPTQAVENRNANILGLNFGCSWNKTTDSMGRLPWSCEMSSLVKLFCWYNFVFDHLFRLFYLFIINQIYVKIAGFSFKYYKTGNVSVSKFHLSILNTFYQQPYNFKGVFVRIQNSNSYGKHEYSQSLLLAVTNVYFFSFGL